MKFFKMILVINVFALALTHCAHKQTENTVIKPRTDLRSPQTSKKLNTEIEAAVKQLLALANLQSIAVNVNEGTGFVSLWGPVPNFETRTKVVELIKRIKGVTSVQDGLYLAQPPAPVELKKTFGEHVRDSWPYLALVFAVGILLLSIWRTRFWTRRPAAHKRFLATASEN